MKKHSIQPIKIVDEFLETPLLWRHFALKQSYEKDQSWHPGKKTLPLDQLNISLFHQLAAKIIVHVTGKNRFERLKIQFAFTTENDKNDLPPHTDEPFYNVAGLIYLKNHPALDAGTSFYAFDQNDNLKCTLEVKNIFNRMILFDPNTLHKQTNMFGKDIEDGRLTIIFFGTAK